MRACAVAVALALVACRTTFDTGPAPVLSFPEWRDGETATYLATSSDSVLYQSTVTITLDEEREPGPGEALSVLTAVVTSVTEPASAGRYFFDSSVVEFERDSLRPLASYRLVETDISELEVTARYSRTRCSIRKATVDGTTEQWLRLGPLTYAGDMVATMLRGISLEPGTGFRASLMVPLEFRTTPTRVQVLGTRLIETDLGGILCREVEVTTPGRSVRHWIELAEPHRYVGMYDALRETQMVIVAWTEDSLEEE
jgi:hypothetical protein